MIDVLGTGCCGTVFRAVFRGEEVAVKLCDLWQHPDYEKEMLTEAKAYMCLEQLQGCTIPKLKGVGYTAGGLFAIVTEIAGSPIEVEELSDQERSEIVTALSDIHDHGVLHKDIRPENILIQHRRDGSKATFIDFALSERVSSKEEPEKEMAILRMMLGLPPVFKNSECVNFTYAL
jgi:serine/threonine protein kinase